MIKSSNGKQKLIDLMLIISGIFGIYLIVAWASYSPLDNAWSVASTVTENTTLNKTGAFGAWWIDLLYAFFGKVAWLVPFSLIAVSFYLLVLRLGSQLTYKKVTLYFMSFLLFMVGLSGLMRVLLSHSPYYLAGGFIGGMWQTYLGESLGQFAALLLAMVCTALGFYFCSGQTVIPLLTSFYEWLTVKDAPKITNAEVTENNDSHLAETDTPFTSMPSVSTEQAADEIPELSSSPALTDVSVFRRPNITGLASTQPQTVNAEQDFPLHSEHVMTNLTDPAMFKVESEVELPKVNVQGFTPDSLPTMEDTPTLSQADEVYEPFDVSLPTVKLANYAEGDEASETSATSETFEVEVEAEPSHEMSISLIDQEVKTPAFIQESSPLSTRPVVRMKPFEEVAIQPETEEKDFEAERARAFEEAEKQRMAEVAERAKAQGLDDTFEQIWQNNSEKAPVFSPSEATIAEAKTAVQPSKPASVDYPKGYGETLIHPLLQRNKVTEKPTTPLPTLDLLDRHPPSSQRVTEEEILSTSHRVETALANYGVKATVEDVLVGPVVTRYEIKPAAGVKAAKVTSLASDLARELMFKAIRITEVVPGKPYMGIEAPNAFRETVWLRDVLDSDAFRHSDAKLPMALGKDISGQPVVVDMAKMPHLLVAGQTGGGKSVGVNTMILSLLFKLTPEQVRFIMIDPKVVELSVYNDIPHLLTPVVTDMKKAANALRWAVEEMERRYQLISYLQVRNIEGYNAKIDQATEMGMPIANPAWRPGDSMDAMPPALEKLSYIVLIVDEFADLMMSAGKEVEEHIMRIAQKARAVGIHLILATQRPSTDVITGVIKANIPSRIAFTVATQIDSRTILDAGGAESLLGRGDMLYSASGSPEILRVHGAFMDDNEVIRVADNWRARGKPNYLDSIVESAEEEVANNGDTSGMLLDSRFDEVAEFVIESGVTSISGIQRRFGLGFNRAAKIIDQMEAQGMISEPGKNGKREVLAR